MDKIDFKKEYKSLYQPSSKTFSLVEVPPLRYLMFDGSGNPNTSTEFEAGVHALYATSYTLKFMSKKELDKDYVVPPLEGLWWADDMEIFSQGKKDQYKWIIMILLPEWINEAMVEDAKLKRENEPFALLRVETLREGLSAQILHIGSYDNEGPVLQQLHQDFMPKNNLTFNGNHHEIYLSDPRKTAPEKLKTILRQPVKKI